MKLNGINGNEKLILNSLKGQSMTIEEVANKTKMHRVTVSKYLAVLEAKGFVSYREIGKAKLFSMTKQGESKVRNHSKTTRNMSRKKKSEKKKEKLKKEIKKRRS